MQLEQFLEGSARRLPNKTALIAGARRLTYSEVDRAANTFAHSLIDNGIQRGDRVVVFMDGSVETIISMFGIMKAGGVFMPVNPATRADKLAYVLNNSRAAAVIADQARLRTLHECRGNTPYLQTVWVATGAVPASDGRHFVSLEQIRAAGVGADSAPAKQSIDLDLAALIYTSGSTGRPKGVMATHLNMVSAASSIAEYLDNSEDDVILNVLPLSFSYGIYQVLVTFRTGGTLILERSFTYPYAVIETMRREQVTGMALVPTIAAILVQLDLEKYPLPSLRYVTNAAAALPTHNLLQLRKLWPHVKIYSMYGQTECARITYLDPAQVDARPASVGRGMPNQECWIVDEEGNRAPVNTVGELVVRGTHVTRGYWEDSSATGKTFRPGPLPGETVLYTGDLFRMDEEGYLYFVSRKDDIIKTRGEKVSPKEVEEVLYTLDGVLEAVVFGVPDPVLGQAIKAVITIKEGHLLSGRDVLKHCSTRLEDFMMPKHVDFVDSIPKTASGKIFRRELALAAAEGAQA